MIPLKMHRLIMAKAKFWVNRDSNLTGYSTTPSESEYGICGLESKLAKSDAINLHGYFADGWQRDPPQQPWDAQ
jgi:hypothetical protein